MTPLGAELKDEIKKGVTLQKVDEEDMKNREAEKKRRMEELEKVKEALGAKN
jgi:spermidine/putrescine-binding protein